MYHASEAQWQQRCDALKGRVSQYRKGGFEVLLSLDVLNYNLTFIAAAGKRPRHASVDFPVGIGLLQAPVDLTHIAQCAPLGVKRERQLHATTTERLGPFRAQVERELQRLRTHVQQAQHSLSSNQAESFKGEIEWPLEFDTAILSSSQGEQLATHVPTR